MGDQASGCMLQSEFFEGVDAIRTSLQAIDKKAVNVFALDSSNIWLNEAVLLGDKYRQDIRYPMDKLSTDNTHYLKVLFADYSVH